MGIRNRFSLNLDLVYKLLAIVPDEGATAAHVREQFPELGNEKVRSLKEWAGDLGLTYQSEQRHFLTALGEVALLVRYSSADSQIQEIIYQKLATSRDLEVFSALVSDFLYEISRSFDQSFELEQAHRRMKSALVTDADPKYIRGEVNTAMRALTSEQAVGRLGMVVPLGGNRYRVNAYRPDWIAAAFMLYDAWPHDTARMGVDRLVTERSSLGRIFFLTEPQVMALLSKLEQERAIALEIVADLRQVGLNPSLKAEDFLEMLTHDGP